MKIILGTALAYGNQKYLGGLFMIGADEQMDHLMPLPTVKEGLLSNSFKKGFVIAIIKHCNWKFIPQW